MGKILAMANFPSTASLLPALHQAPATGIVFPMYQPSLPPPKRAKTEAVAAKSPAKSPHRQRRSFNHAEFAGWTAEEASDIARRSVALLQYALKARFGDTPCPRFAGGGERKRRLAAMYLTDGPVALGGTPRQDPGAESGEPPSLVDGPDGGWEASMMLPVPPANFGGYLMAAPHEVPEEEDDN